MDKGLSLFSGCFSRHHSLERHRTATEIADILVFPEGGKSDKGPGKMKTYTSGFHRVCGCLEFGKRTAERRIFLVESIAKP